jgi:hypothetical protein
VKKQHLGRTAPFVILLLLLAFGILLGGVYPGAQQQGATAATPGTGPDITMGPGPDITISPDLFKPRILDRYPADGTTGVALSSNISVEFYLDLDADTIKNSSNFYLQEDDFYGTGIKVPATITYNTGADTAVLNPDANLLPGMKYWVTVTNGVKSPLGYTLANPGSWSFTTDTAPEIVSRSPAPGAVGVPVDQNVTVTFDKDMKAPPAGQFSLKEVGGETVTGPVSLSANKRTFTLNPTANLKANTQYQVTLTSAIKSETEVPIIPAPVTWTFTTAADTPMVVSTFPAPDATGVPVDLEISATFDRNMAYPAPGSFRLREVSSSTFLGVTLGRTPDKHTLLLQPGGTLEGNTQYQVLLTEAIESETGVHLLAPLAWTFTTEGTLPPPPSSPFSDVNEDTPYAEAILALAEEGVITGFLDGTFRPYQLVTRQQFAKMIVLALDLSVTGSEVCPFGDVMAQDGTDPFYPSKYVAKCASEGITVGKTSNTFAPYDNITHQQLITMVTRASGVGDPPPGFTPTFSAGQFSLNEHYQNARKAAYAGLLDGLLGIGPSYNFLAGSTRGECAQILYNLMNL